MSVTKIVTVLKQVILQIIIDDLSNYKLHPKRDAIPIG